MSMTGRTVGRGLIALVAALLVATLGLPPASASPRAAAEEAFVKAINADRKAQKLGELVPNPELAAIAGEWSAVMAGDRNLRHNDKLRNQVEQRVTKDWKRIGENVGYTRKTDASDDELVQRLHRAFMDSSGHRANILGDFNQVGVGVRRNSDGTMWVTAVFLNGPLPKQVAPPSTGPGGFADVSGVHAGNIASLVEAGVASGFGDGSFRPKDPVNRGQMATFIAQAMGLPGQEKDQFGDVGNTHRTAINALALEGIAGGYPDGTYRPRATVTRGQMAKFLVAARDLEPLEDGPFNDTGSSTFRREINALHAEGIAGGFSDGTFRPNRTVTREQMATFLVEAFGIGK